MDKKNSTKPFFSFFFIQEIKIIEGQMAKEKKLIDEMILFKGIKVCGNDIKTIFALWSPYFQQKYCEKLSQKVAEF